MYVHPLRSTPPAARFVVPGCTRSSGEADMSPAFEQAVWKPNSSEPAYIEDDLGTILADGQAIHHDFTVRNMTGRAMLAGPVAPPADSANHHRLAVSINTARGTAGRLDHITFHTNHPDQPEVAASVIVMGPSEGQVHAKRQIPGGVHPH